MPTKKEIILHAKEYIDKLSDGINPLTDKNVASNDVVTEPQIITCLQHISRWLDELVLIEESSFDCQELEYIKQIKQLKQANLDLEKQLNSLASSNKENFETIQKLRYNTTAMEKEIVRYHNANETLKLQLNSMKEDLAYAYAKNNHSAQTTKAKSTKNCNTCRHSKNGSCSGRGRVCSDYEKAFSFTEEQKQNWPKDMDATYYKRHNKPRK